jgi:hypothetical protein
VKNHHKPHPKKGHSPRHLGSRRGVRSFFDKRRTVHSPSREGRNSTKIHLWLQIRNRSRKRQDKNRNPPRTIPKNRQKSSLRSGRRILPIRSRHPSSSSSPSVESTRLHTLDRNGRLLDTERCKTSPDRIRSTRHVRNPPPPRMDALLPRMPQDLLQQL